MQPQSSTGSTESPLKKRCRIALGRGDKTFGKQRKYQMVLALYKHIVGEAGGEDSVAIKQQTLAEEMKCSRRTINTHLSILEARGLIWRESAHNNICRYYIAAYRPQPQVEQPKAEVQVITDPALLLQLSQAALEAGDLDRAGAYAFQASEALRSQPDVHQLASDEPPVPVPGDAFFSTPSCDPEITEAVQPRSQPSIKELNQGVNQGATAPQPPMGGGSKKIRHQAHFIGREEPNTPSYRLLKAKGMRCATRYAEHPLADIQDAIAYVDGRRRPPNDYPAYLKWVIDEGVHRSAVPRMTEGDPADDASPPGAADVAAPDEHGELWRRAVARMDVPDGERRTWLDCTHLVAVEHDRAFVTTPNVFVRDTVVGLYLTQLTDALTAEQGSPLSIEVVIN